MESARRRGDHPWRASIRGDRAAGGRHVLGLDPKGADAGSGPAAALLCQGGPNFAPSFLHSATDRSTAVP